MDDPLFIWTAKQIRVNPANFYGFSVNWYWVNEPMFGVTKNPPAASYYIALVGAFFGWSEIALHIAFLIPAVGAALGMYYLARELCSRPVVAALAAVLTPAFLVSSTNVMCDTMMLAFWLWAVVFWMRGIKTDKWWSLLIGSALIGICALTKYFGMVLVGLLFVYSVVQKRRVGIWAVFLLIPVVMLGAYQWLTHILYGRGLLSDAAAYVSLGDFTKRTDLFAKTLTGLAFTGGCVITALFYSPFFWRRWVLIIAIILTVLFVFLLSFAKKIGDFPVSAEAGSIRWGFLVQLGIMVAAGIGVLALAGEDFWKSRNADSILLLLWVAGTFIFAVFINWTTNARSILPMVPAVGILFMRQIDRYGKDKQGRLVVILLIPAAIIALLVGWADYALANTARTVAGTMGEKFRNWPGSVWFQGHWGFQYYMESKGYRAFDFASSVPAPGDIMIIPLGNTNVAILPEELTSLKEIMEFTSSRWLGIVHPPVGAGFYSDIWGPLPFAFGAVKPEKYCIFIIQYPNVK